MASEAITLFILGLDDRRLALIIGHDSTFAGLYDAVSLKIGLAKEELIFYYKCEHLKESNEGIPLTFNNYGIKNYSTIIAGIKFPGGGGGISSLRFADMTSADCFETLRLTTGGPDYRIVKKGLNFSGICRNSFCIAYKKHLQIPKGMFERNGGSCFVSQEVEKLNCPICDTSIPDKDCTGLGILDCRADIECMTKKNQLSNYTIVANKDEFKRVEEIKHRNKVKYKYITICLSN